MTALQGRDRRLKSCDSQTYQVNSRSLSSNSSQLTPRQTSNDSSRPRLSLRVQSRIQRSARTARYLTLQINQLLVACRLAPRSHDHLQSRTISSTCLLLKTDWCKGQWVWQSLLILVGLDHPQMREASYNHLDLSVSRLLKTRKTTKCATDSRAWRYEAWRRGASKSKTAAQKRRIYRFRMLRKHLLRKKKRETRVNSYKILRAAAHRKRPNQAEPLSTCFSTTLSKQSDSRERETTK